MRIFLLSHSSGLKGPVDFLKDYLLRKKYTIIHLEHPLDKYEDKYSSLFKNKKILSKEKRIKGGFTNLFIDFFISLKKARAYSYEIFIGANNFDTLTAIILRGVFFKKIKKIIYFSSDFSENRYSSSLMNFIYLFIERIVLKYADTTISNTNRAEKKRLQMGLLQRKSWVISNGVYLSQPKFPKKVIHKDMFVYVGNVTQEHGIFNFIKSFHRYIKKLVVIGQGDQWERLKIYCKKNNISSQFYFQKSHEETIAYLQEFNGFGLAPYTKDSLWTWYSSPLKINEYISCGIPLITSDIPEISEYVLMEKLGIVYSGLDREKIQKKLHDFRTEAFNKKAKSFYQQYRYDSLYSKLPL